jgi:iron complex outermembrane receptor protein
VARVHAPLVSHRLTPSLPSRCWPPPDIPAGAGSRAGLAQYRSRQCGARDTGQQIERFRQAIRRRDLAPISQKTIRRDVITQRLRAGCADVAAGASPSAHGHTETGHAGGYSYLRLRGVDQTRINITLDGVPLNDMEDQVLYFADLPDLMASVQSVQVQRGVGTSTAGTASYAGSVNFETVPLAVRGAGGDASVQLGSFGARRVSGAFHSGLTGSGLPLVA